MPIFGKKLAGDARTFGSKLYNGVHNFGMKIGDHPFRKIHNTLHQVNGALGAAAAYVPALSPISAASKFMEGASGALRGVTFTDSHHTNMSHKPLLER